jgi:SAM-dependent methyltransferase
MDTISAKQMTTSELQSTANHALELIDDSIGFIYPSALGTFAQLGVADHLADGPRTVAELAEATATHAPFLHRVLRLLTTRGVLGQDGHGRFYLTPRGEPLRSESPLSVRRAITTITSPLIWRPAGEMVTSVREGEPVFDRVFGASFFEHVARDPELAAAFHSGMASISDVYDLIVAEQLNLPPEGTVVDVGGGYGGLLLRILLRHEGLRGVLFDQQHVLDGHMLGALDADERWEVAAGDFFTEVPAGAEVYVLKGVLHDWSDEQCVTILRNCRRAMAPGGRVLISEIVIEPGGESRFGKTMDVFMMGILPGRERTEAEFAALLNAAGLRLGRVVPTKTPASIIEAVAA